MAPLNPAAADGVFRVEAGVEETDQDLADRVTQGDQAAFALLFERYRVPVCRHLVRMLRDPATSDDLAQEVFLRLWQRASERRPEASLRFWLLRIATNLALNHLRAVRRRREQPVQLALPPQEDEEDDVPPAWMIDAVTLPPDEALFRSERQRLLDRSVNQLSPGKQEVLRLLYEAHLETGQIAARLGIPEGTVKSRLHHARREIARSWHEQGIEWEDL